MGLNYKVILLDENDQLIIWMNPIDYDNSMKLMDHSYINSELIRAVENAISPEGLYYKSKVIWSIFNDTMDNNKKYNFWTSCKKYYQYIVNYTKKQFVNKDHYLYISIIHPLPLLVAENANYIGYNKELCGTWIGDIIAVEENIPDEFTELICEFNE